LQTDRDRPWMTALEMQFATLAISRAILDRGDTADPPPKRLLVAAAAVSYPLSVASTYSWSSETATAVLLASKSIPETTRVSEMVLPDGRRDAWWYFESPLPLWQKQNSPPDIDWKHVSAMLCSPADDGGVSLVGFRKSPKVRGLYPGPIVFLKRDAPLRACLEDANSQEGIAYAIDAIRFFLAASVWLQQRIIIISSSGIERHRRKQIARELKIEPPFDVKVIELRRAEPKAAADTADSHPVDWSCRWLVSGHWRNQFHPSTGKHELIYVLPHVKGPEDKPLKVPAQTVYSVSR
jgi:hypothetical protein